MADGTCLSKIIYLSALASNI